jgi:hypothetical protein
MSDPHVPSKPREAAPLHRSEIAGAISSAASGAVVMGAILSPGGDPYSMIFYSACLFPAAVVMYWLGLRHGRAIGERHAKADSLDSSRFAP